MKNRMVSYTLETLPPITAKERKQLARLAALAPDEIDFSDIPEVTDEQAKGAVRGWENHPGRTRNHSNMLLNNA
jgi:hypothetical protein